MTWIRACAVIVLLLVSLPSVILGQAAASKQRELEIWGNLSFDTLTIGSLSESDVQGRKLFIAGLRYSVPLKSSGRLAVLYTLDAIPAVVAFSSQLDSENRPVTEPPRGNVYGMGASPIGLMLLHQSERPVQPFGSASGGFLWFHDPVPSAVGTHWNFTAAAGGGLRFKIGDQRAIDVGYLFHHISNGRDKARNPSLNSQVIYFGIVFLKIQ